MVISKTTAIAGTLGGGGGAIVAGSVIYATSQGETDLEKVRKEIEEWAKKKGGCTIEVKDSGDTDSNFKDLNDFTKTETLQSLFKFLNQAEQDNDNSGSKCQVAKSANNSLKATYTDSKKWTVTANSNA